jgi:amino acid transporter
MSALKILILCGIIILSLVLALGGGPDHDRKRFRYWKNPGVFKPYLAQVHIGQFVAL